MVIQRSLWAPPKLCTLPVLSDLGDRDNFGGSFGRLREQLADSIGELGSVAGPVSNAVALQFQAGGAGPWIIGADDFDRPAIAGTIFFNDNDAVVRLLSRTNARQTDHQHRNTFHNVILGGVAERGTRLRTRHARAPTPKYLGNGRNLQSGE